MQIPQALPTRNLDLTTDDAGELAAAQPERGRDYVQIGAGSLRAVLRERLYGNFGLLQERWGCGLRVRCARPRSYVAFSSVSSNAMPNWCGLGLGPDDVIEVAGDWEITAQAPLESLSFAVEQDRLDRVESFLFGRDFSPGSSGNRVLRSSASTEASRALRDLVAKALEAGPLAPEAQHALEAELVHLAARLRSWGASSARPEPSARRYAAVRSVEAYLEAYPRALPSLAELCAIAGVRERTLEYGFREYIGTTPARYLRLRRLNGVRRELRTAEAESSVRVTDVAMRWGFWELGRFASEYRALFGEQPSQTLASRRR